MKFSFKKSTRLQLSLASFAALGLFASQSARAQDTLSATAPATASWGTNSNWMDNSFPTVADNVIIDYSSNPSVTTVLGLDGARSANSLTFGSANGPALGAFSLLANSTAVATAQTLTVATGGFTFASNLTGAVTLGGTNGVLTLSTGATSTTASTGYTFTNNSSQAVNLNAVIGNNGNTVAAAALTTIFTGSGTGVFTIGATNTYGFGAAVGTVTTSIRTATVRVTANNLSPFGSAGQVNLANTTSVLQLGGNTVNVFAITSTLAGAVIENASATNGTLNLTQGSANTNLAATIRDGAGGGTLSIVKGTGGNGLQLTGANTFTGSVSTNSVVQAGSLNSVATNATLGTVHSASSNLGAPVTVANGTIVLGQTNTTGNSGGTLTYVGTGEITDRVINLANTSTPSTINQSGTGTLRFVSDLTTTSISNKNLTLGGSTAGIGQFAGVIADNANTATVTANTFATGATTVTVPGGVVTGNVTSASVGATITGPGIAGGTTITGYNNGTGQYTLSQPTTAAGGGAANQVTFSGGATSITKAGTGTWALTSLTGNSYSGGTTLSAGTLSINNTSGSATGTGPVAFTGIGTGAAITTLSSGAGSVGILTGTVTTNGTTTARIAPGGVATVGLLTLNSLNAAAGATFAFDLGATSGGTSSDRIQLTSTGVLTGSDAANGLVFAFTGTGTAGTRYSLIDFTATPVGLDLSDLSSTGISGTFDITATGIGFTPVPEPSTMVGTSLFLAMLGWVGYKHIRRNRTVAAS